MLELFGVPREINTRKRVINVFENRDYRGIDLSGAHLPVDYVFVTCNFNGADLSRVSADLNFGGSSFRGANLAGAFLVKAEFGGCDFTSANLTSISALRADFSRAIFVRANLCEADLRRSSLFEVDMTDANLCGAVVSYCGFTSPLRLKGANVAGVEGFDTVWTPDDVILETDVGLIKLSLAEARQFLINASRAGR